MPLAYRLDFNTRRRLHDRAYRAQQKEQREVCGVLVLHDGDRLDLRFCTNQASRAGAWQIDEREYQIMREDDILGIIKK